MARHCLGRSETIVVVTPVLRQCRFGATTSVRRMSARAAIFRGDGVACNSSIPSDEDKRADFLNTPPPALRRLQGLFRSPTWKK